ncbi:hypothetical protein QJS56_11375 [Bacillus altitudinis]|nr:hypothetical protein QJS56_11375 [Bacillus altitudinis]
MNRKSDLLIISLCLLGILGVILMLILKSLNPGPAATILSGLVVGVLAYLGVRLSVTIATKNSKENMLTDTVTKERIAWQNKLREKFADYNKLILEMFKETDRSKVSETDEQELSQKLRIKQTECQAVLSYIKLLLNPSENPHRKLQKELHKLLGNVSRVKLEFNVFDPLEKVEFLQQVLLKFEWKRINEEAENGEKLSDERIDELYKITACRINPNLADEILGYTNCFICKCDSKCKCRK